MPREAEAEPEGVGGRGEGTHAMQEPMRLILEGWAPGGGFSPLAGVFFHQDSIH